VTVEIARRLFQVAALLYAAAGVIAAPQTGARAPVPVNTHSFTRYQSLAAFGLPPRAVYFVCFSPAFIFDNLPRGPPCTHLKDGSSSIKSVLAKHSLPLFDELSEENSDEIS